MIGICLFTVIEMFGLIECKLKIHFQRLLLSDQHTLASAPCLEPGRMSGEHTIRHNI